MHVDKQEQDRDNNVFCEMCLDFFCQRNWVGSRHKTVTSESKMFRGLNAQGLGYSLPIRGTKRTKLNFEQLAYCAFVHVEIDNRLRKAF